MFNDIDDGVTNLYRVLRDPQQAEELERLIGLTPYSRHEYYDCLRTWKTCADPVEKARCWLYVAATSYSGRFGSGWRYSAVCSHRGMSGLVSTYLTQTGRLRQIAERFRRVIVENLDFEDCIKKYDTPNTAFYADPPYVWSTRNKECAYQNEMSDADHLRFIEAVLHSKGAWIISGYDHPLYAPLETHGWQHVDIKVNSSAARRNPARDTHRTEVLWISPQEGE